MTLLRVFLEFSKPQHADQWSNGILRPLEKRFGVHPRNQQVMAQSRRGSQGPENTKSGRTTVSLLPSPSTPLLKTILFNSGAFIFSNSPFVYLPCENERVKSYRVRFGFAAYLSIRFLNRLNFLSFALEPRIRWDIFVRPRRRIVVSTNIIQSVS